MRDQSSTNKLFRVKKKSQGKQRERGKEEQRTGRKETRVSQVSELWLVGAASVSQVSEF